MLHVPRDPDNGRLAVGHRRPLQHPHRLRRQPLAELRPDLEQRREVFHFAVAIGVAVDDTIHFIFGAVSGWPGG